MDEPRNSPICNSIDRLSNLPETLIHYILSFMDMKHVVQTCVLSKRWKHLRTCTPVLNFDFDIFSLAFHRNENNGLAVQQLGVLQNQNNALQQLALHQNQNNALAAPQLALRRLALQQLAFHHNGVVPPAYQKFIQFVDQVFILRDGSDIQRVNLVCGKQLSSFDITASLTTWLVAAVRRNIQELFLDISGVKISRFPQCLFTCTSLCKLELKLGAGNSSIMVLPASMGLPGLTFMKLDSLPSTDVNLTNRLFERCPVLESLIIEGHLGLMDLQISSLTLKHLKIVDFVKTPSKDVSLTNRLFERCPILESLIIEGPLSHMDLHISSLTLKHLKIVDRLSKTSSKVMIDAPNLVSFECRDYISKWYVLGNLASLVTADIDMIMTKGEAAGKWKDYAGNQWLLLRALSNAKEIRLSGSFLFLSLLAKGCAKGVLAAADKISLQFSNLQVVKLKSNLSKACVEALGGLLHIN